MIIHCPHCSSGFDLIQAWQDEDARRFTALITSLPPKAIKPCFIYLKHCFKPTKQALRWSKLLKLLQELAPMITDAQIKRNGTFYRVPLERWVITMQGLVESPPETLKLPLKDHAYLLTILANQAEQVAGKAESKIESDRQSGIRQKTDTEKSIISFAELTETAVQRQQEVATPAATQPKAVETDKRSPMPLSVKDALKRYNNTPELSEEEREERRLELREQARQLMETPQPTLDKS